jgi:hypothetical protein
VPLLRFARNVFRRRHLEEDLDEEIRAHLELMVDGKLASGMDDQAARRAPRDCRNADDGLGRERYSSTATPERGLDRWLRVRRAAPRRDGARQRVSGSVTRRRHELALRIALGGKHQRVLRLVVAEGAWLVGLGVMVGLPGIYVAGQVIRGVLVARTY